MTLLRTPGPGPVSIEVTPNNAGWRYLAFKAITLHPDDTFEIHEPDREIALVPIAGQAEIELDGITETLARKSVFAELPRVVYAPPGVRLRVQAKDAFDFAVGSAPAEGKLPPRIIEPAEIPVEIRGGANATRQISHILAPPLPAERLLLFEVYTPSGNWSSWPPHRHDGGLDSPYLEEVYYYRFQPEEGWAIQRIYNEHIDEVVLVRDGEAVLVPQGYHPVAAAPGSNVYYLNFLAGDERTTAVVDDPEWAWMRNDWSGRAIQLPIGGRVED